MTPNMPTIPEPWEIALRQQFAAQLHRLRELALVKLIVDEAGLTDLPAILALKRGCRR